MSPGRKEAREILKTSLACPIPLPCHIPGNWILQAAAHPCQHNSGEACEHSSTSSTSARKANPLKVPPPQAETRQEGLSRSYTLPGQIPYH